MAADTWSYAARGRGTFVVPGNAEQHVQFRFLKLVPDLARPAVKARRSATLTAAAAAPADIAHWRCAPVTQYR
jgi:hypothetical protein